MTEEQVLNFSLSLHKKLEGKSSQTEKSEIETNHQLVLSLQALKNEEVAHILLHVSLYSVAKMKDGSYVLIQGLENVIRTLQDRDLCSKTMITVEKRNGYDKRLSVELMKLINSFILRDIQLHSLELSYHEVKNTKSEAEALFAGITNEHKIVLPPLEAELAFAPDSYPGLEFLSRFLEVDWPIKCFSLEDDFSKVETDKWDSLKKLIHGKKFNLSLDQTGTEIKWDVKPLINALGECGDLDLRRFPMVWEIVSIYFDPSSPRWKKTGPKPMKALLVNSALSDGVNLKQGTCNVTFDKKDETAFLQPLLNLVNDKKLGMIERLNLSLQEKSSLNVAKKIFSSLARQPHNLISVTATLSMEKVDIPKNLRKQLENNLPKKMADWTRNGTEVRYGRMKLMVIGNGQAGKSSTIRSLLGKAFDPNIKSTVVAAEKDVSISVKDISFSRWQEMNLGANWVADEMGDYFNKLQNNVAAVEGAVVWDRDKAVEVNLKGAGADTIEPVWLRGRKKSSEVKKTNNLQKKAKAVFANVRKGLRGKSPQSSNEVVDASADHNRLTIWDFGGQEVFYALHHLYLTTGGLYVLVFDLMQMKKNEKSELNIIQFWLESTSLHAPGSGVILVGTRCDQVSPEDLIKIDQTLQLMIVEQKLRFRGSGQYCFYPIDNSNESNIQSKLQPLKEKINQCFSTEESDESFVWQKKVSLAWMYFMNHLVTNFNGMITSNQLYDIAKSMNLDKDRDVIPMLTFYKNAGAIIPFMKNGFNKEPGTSDYIVLSPEWLLEALGSFIYDRRLHKKDHLLYGSDTEASKLIVQYESTGLIPKTFLRQLLNEAKLSEVEIGFLLGICEEMLIMSTYEFKAGEEAQWLVPTMNSKLSTEAEISQRAALEDCHNVYMRWDRYVPCGLFERVICVMLSCNSGYDGKTLTPFISRNFCEFTFRGTNIFLVNESHNKDFRISVAKDNADTEPETSILILNLLDIVQVVSENMRVDVLGQELHSDIQVEVSGSKLRCKWKDLKVALKSNETTVASFLSDERPQYKKLKVFGPFTETARLSLESDLKAEVYNDTEDTGSLDLSRVLDVTEVAFMTSLPEEQIEDKISLHALPWEWDCFLSHTWGPDNVTHNHVLEVRNELEARQIKTWTDEYNLKQYISYDIVRGLRKSSCILIFITKQYLARVNNPNTHAAKEFKQAALKGSSFLIPVVLEKECLKDEIYLGWSVGYHLSDLKRYDLSSQEAFDQNFEKLISAISEFRSRRRPPNSFDTPPVQPN